MVATRRPTAAHPLVIWAVTGAAAAWLALAAIPASARAQDMAAQTASQDAEALAVARAFGAAWNAHDLDGVVALFAPDAVVRQPTVLRTVFEDGASGLGDVYTLGDVFGTGESGAALWAPFAVERDGAVWRGTAAIRSWTRRLFDLRHRAEATGYAAAAGGVAWRYRAHVDPYQTVPGVPPVEGTATAAVRSGRITELTVLGEPGSAEVRREALRRASVGVNTAHSAGAAGCSPVVAAPRAAAEPAPPAPQGDVGAPLVAVGFGAAAFALAAARGRARRIRWPAGDVAALRK